VGLKEYRRKRDFGTSPEPRGADQTQHGTVSSFVVQKHAARRLHYDFRLELDGVLKSWAVPKGPSLVAGVRRMAAQTEDHPLEYADFEGIIPQGEYGGGTVLVWDQGSWQPIGDARAGLEKGDLKFELSGKKLRGRWHLVRMRQRPEDRGKASWLLIKGRDREARAPDALDITETDPHSVVSGRTLEEVARAADRRWSSEHGEERAASPRAPAASELPLEIQGSELRSRSSAASARAERTSVQTDTLAEAQRASLPRTLTPQLATLVKAPPDGEEWIHEIKLDGYRLLCRIDRGHVRLKTRAGHDWTERFPMIARALTELPVDSALIDAEAVSLDTNGRSDFQALQSVLSERRGLVHLFAFDLVHLEGHDLRAVPLVERKLALQQLLAHVAGDSILKYNDHVRGHGQAFFAEVCDSGLEGVVSKRADAPYRSGRSRSWLKVKCSRRQEFVIVGFTDPSGSRVGLGALLLGAHDAEGELRYTGKVGTGFDTKMLVRLRKTLGALVQPKPAVVDPLRGRGLHWVEPRLVAEVAFTEWTRDGRARHPKFVGLREDKPAAEVRIEAEVDRSAAPDGDTPSGDAPAADTRSSAAAPRRSSARGEARSKTDREPSLDGHGSMTTTPPPLRNEVAGIHLSTPDRVYFPDLGITKSELAQYYERVAERALPGLLSRPLSLVRCPEGIEGECFYQKQANRSIPKNVPRVTVRAGRQPYAMVKDLPSLISLVQVAVLELHVWGARADRLDRPDIMVLDLDPDPTVSWRRVADTAQVLRELLGELGLNSFVRSTGGKGLHVVTPLLRRSTWDEVKGFAQAIARQLVSAAPEHYVAEMSKAKRHGRIFIDYLRNDIEATAIASWSVRARAGAPVAMPLAWDELAADELPIFGLREAPSRLELPDPWADFETSRRALTREMRARVDASAR